MISLGYIISILLFVSFSFLLFPPESFLNKSTKYKFKVTTLTGYFLLFILVFLGVKLGVSYFLHLLFIVIVIGCLLFGLSIHRSKIFFIALSFLAATPLLLILKMDFIAKYMANFSYMLIVLGVLRDILYEKIFIK